MPVLITELPFAAFDRTFATYWGRRSLGLVIDDPLAGRLRSDWRRVRGLHKAWLTALRDFPAETTGLRLCGTPALTPDILESVRGALNVNDAPPPPVVGPYADPTAPRSPGLVPTVHVAALPGAPLIADHMLRGILARLRVHWTELDARGTATSIAARVSGRLWLQAWPPAAEGAHWSVLPVVEDGDVFTEWAFAHRYQLGVTAAHSPDDVADRLYNELGYWWISCARLLQS